ncbi:MAG: PQQ-binding-like beta-propeller repeat protein, partial [Stackebrandtia sp.]
AQGNDADDASGVEQLHKLEQLGEPIEYPGSDADDPGSVPEPVTAGGVAYFTHGGDDPRIIAVDLSTGKQKWRKPVSEPIGIALRAGREALYTADTEAGIVNFIDRESGESANVVELGGRITVGSAGDLVVVFAEDSETVSAYRADGSRAWERSFDSAVVELDIEAEWRKFSTQPGRYSKQDPRHMIIYGEDGMVWRLDTGSGDTVDSFDTGDDNLATLAHQGYMFTATQADDGTYTVTMRDVGDDFAEVGQWDSLRKGYTPRKLVACGKTRICVKDNDYGATGGAVVIDFGDTDGDPLWQSPADSNVTEVYAAGSTTAVVDGGQDSEPSTQLYNSEFEPLGRSKPGTFRPIDGRTFLDYPRTAGTEPANPLGEHFFTGLDAADGSTRDLGMREVHPQCVTDGSHMACSTPEGITVWGYRDGK